MSKLISFDTFIFFFEPHSCCLDDHQNYLPGTYNDRLNQKQKYPFLSVRYAAQKF